MHKLSDSDVGKCIPAPVAKPNRNPLTFSIIIPALNEENVIGRCLDSIARLTFPHRNFEVIIVDNGSSDRTCEIAESYRGAMQITVLIRPKISISALRNAGASASSGEFLIFLDSDMRVPTDWLRNAEALFASSKTGILGGFYDAPENSSWVGRVWFKRKAKTVNLSPSYVPSGNLMVRRSQFDAIGGFDESLRTSEDCDFCCRACALGLNLAIHDAISVVHLGSPQTLGAFFKREIWHGTSVLRVFLLHCSRFQNYKPVLFAIYTLLCILTVAATGIISAHHGDFTLGLPFVAMLLLPPFALALRSARGGRWQDFPPLFLLFLVYGIARAISLMGYRYHRTLRHCQADGVRAAPAIGYEFAESSRMERRE